MHTKNSHFWGVFFAQNQFSWPNGQFLPIAYHAYSESYCSSALQRLIWHIWGPATCILWPVRFFVTLRESTGSISWNLVLRTFRKEEQMQPWPGQGQGRVQGIHERREDNGAWGCCPAATQSFYYMGHPCCNSDHILIINLSTIWTILAAILILF